jgi:hypothetical protein
LFCSSGRDKKLHTAPHCKTAQKTPNPN